MRRCHCAAIIIAFNPRNELEQLVAVGICQHGRADIDSRRQPRPWPDADEYSLHAWHHVHAESRSREVHRILFPFRERLDFFFRLRRGVRTYGKSDMVVWDANRIGSSRLCSHHATADFACDASTNGQ